MNRTDSSTMKQYTFIRQFGNKFNFDNLQHTAVMCNCHFSYKVDMYYDSDNKLYFIYNNGTWKKIEENKINDELGMLHDDAIRNSEKRWEQTKVGSGSSKCNTRTFGFDPDSVF